MTAPPADTTLFPSESAPAGDTTASLDALTSDAPPAPAAAPPPESADAKRGPGRPTETRFTNRRSKREMQQAGRELEAKVKELEARLAPTAEGAAHASEEEQRKLAAALAMLFDKAQQIATLVRGPHWKMEKEETQMLGDVWAVPLLPYVGKAGPWFAAGITTALVIGPRVVIDWQIQQRAAAQAADAEVRTAS